MHFATSLDIHISLAIARRDGSRLVVVLLDVELIIVIAATWFCFRCSRMFHVWCDSVLFVVCTHVEDER